LRKIEGKIKFMGRRRRRRKQLLHESKERRILEREKGSIKELNVEVAVDQS